MNDYFNTPIEFTPGTLIKAEDFNTINQALETAFEGLEIQIDRTVRLPVGVDGQIAQTAQGRALRVIGFDEDGNIQLRSSFQFVGDWMTGNLYLQNQVFRDPVSKNLYTVNFEHTSTSIAADLTAQKIVLAINVQDVTDARDGAIQAATEAFGFRNESQGFRNETLAFRNEAEFFRDEAEEFSLTAINAPGTSATSMTTHTLDLTSPKTFMIQPGKAFAVGQFVIIASNANPSKYFVAQIQLHDPVAGTLTVSIITFDGTGSASDWVISLTAVANGAVTVINVSNNTFYRVVLTGDAGSGLFRGVNGTQNLDYNPATGNLRSVTFTGNLIGNADTATSAQSANTANSATSATNATNATNVNVTTTGANASYPLVLAPNQTTGQQALLMDSSGGTYNPSTNTAAINISGNAATATSANTANSATTATTATTATSATNTTNINVTTTAANANYPLVLAPNQTTGQQALLIDSSAGTYNPATNTADINITGNAANATTAAGSNNLNALGRKDNAAVGTAVPATGVRHYYAYANGYPTPYGNVVELGGEGGAQLLLGWSGSDGAHAPNYVRSKRDNNSGPWSPWAELLTSANYNAYSPTLTGGGASGTWGINITGTAANSNQLGGISSNRAILKRRGFIGNNSGFSLNGSITAPEMGFTYGGSGEATGPYIAFGGLGADIDYSCQMVAAYSGGGARLQFRTRNDDLQVWNPWREVLHDGNYNGYSPTLTGGGASGTWNINITGNAETVDGYSASIGQTPNTAVVRDGNGYTYHNYINSNTGNDENPGISQIIVTNGDNFYRKASLQHLRNSLGITSGGGAVEKIADISLGQSQTFDLTLPANYNSVEIYLDIYNINGGQGNAPFMQSFSVGGTQNTFYAVGTGGDGNSGPIRLIQATTNFILSNFSLVQGSVSVNTYKLTAIASKTVSASFSPYALIYEGTDASNGDLYPSNITWGIKSLNGNPQNPAPNKTLRFFSNGSFMTISAYGNKV